MTLIVDGNGPRWVELPKRKRRKSPRALRFAGVKVGDQLMLMPLAEHYRKKVLYYVVTDLWFDPVEGQDDPLRGSMVGYSNIKDDGTFSHKSSTTIRGLASQKFLFADIDYIELCKTRSAEVDAGKVVGIGHGTRIRSRPKISGL